MAKLTQSRTATAKPLQERNLNVGNTADNGYGPPQIRSRPGNTKVLYDGGVHNEWIYGSYQYGEPGEKKFKTTPQTGNPAIEGGGGHENG